MFNKEIFTSTGLNVLKLSLITRSGIPRLDVNLLTAPVNDGIDMSGVNSRWIARLEALVNNKM